MTKIKVTKRSRELILLGRQNKDIPAADIPTDLELNKPQLYAMLDIQRRYFELQDWLLAEYAKEYENE